MQCGGSFARMTRLKGCIIKFSLELTITQRKIHDAILRGTYFAELGDWHFSARIKINGKDQGICFVSKGATDNKVNTGQGDF